MEGIFVAGGLLGLVVADGRDAAFAIEEILELLRASRVEGVADNFLEELLSRTNLVVALKCQLLPHLLVYSHSPNHSLGDGSMKGHLALEGSLPVDDWPIHLGMNAGLLGLDTPGLNRVLAVVGPQNLLVHVLRVPFLALVFPVNVVVEVERGKEVETFGQGGEE